MVCTLMKMLTLMDGPELNIQCEHKKILSMKTGSLKHASILCGEIYFDSLRPIATNSQY